MRRALPSKSAVLEALESQDRPIHANELAMMLGVEPASYQGLLRLLDDLVFDGVLVASGHRFKLVRQRRGSRPPSSGPASERGARSERSPRTGRSEHDARGARGRERREGLLTVNPRGFGFVASPVASGDDVFIGAEGLGGAMHGDQVIVEIVARGSRGPEGHIVEVTKRGTTRVSGILRRKGKSAWVDPDDPRVRGPVVLSREIDRTGPEGNSGQDGQVVVVEITRFPDDAGENPEGALVAVLGQPGELSVEVSKVLFLAKIDELHSSEAIAEAEAYGAEVPAAMLEGREDLTHIPLPTIDPDDARDHDDAVWVTRTDSGGYEVWVAIADVSSYVRPETKLDEEARTRGCSVYLPDRAIPMLPRALSSNLCSLLPDVTRLCLCVHAELDARGAIKRTRLIRGFMRSAAKLTYGGVARALGFTTEPAVQPKAEAMVEDLRVAYEVSRILRSRRLERGALDFDLPEPVVKLDTQGKPIGVSKRASDPGVKKAYQLIEELMIFANEVVARWLLERSLPGIYRVHLPPDPKKLERLAAMCEVLGIELDVDETQTPKGLATILASFAKHPNAPVLNNLLLRSMKQAAYDISNLGHFGLASEAYLHFTSPIRRYPDLVDHRIIHAALERDEHARKKALRGAGSKEDLEASALQSSFAERRAMESEREILDIYRCFFMMDHIGERFEGTVSAFVGSGAFVTLEEPFVDVLVKTEELGGEFVIEDDGLMATNKRSGESIRLGDRLLLEITDVAILRRAVYAKRVSGGSGDESGETRTRHPRPTKPGKPGKPFKAGKPTKPGRPSKHEDSRKKKGTVARPTKKTKGGKAKPTGNKKTKGKKRR